MCGDEYDVRPEGAALDALKRLKPEKRAHVWVAFQELKTDPYPRHLEEPLGFLSFKVVKSLKAKGFDVFRLRSKVLGNLRMLYFILEPEHQVLVKEIVKKSSQTYELDSPHIQRLIENYERWGLLASGKELPC